MWVLLGRPRFGGAIMQVVTTIGLDIAKSVFQVHGVDAEGNVIIRRQLGRRYVLAFFEKLAPCLVGIEACAASHHWSRQLQALGLSRKGKGKRRLIGELDPEEWDLPPKPKWMRWKTYHRYVERFDRYEAAIDATALSRASKLLRRR